MCTTREYCKFMQRNDADDDDYSRNKLPSALLGHLTTFLCHFYWMGGYAMYIQQYCCRWCFSVNGQPSSSSLAGTSRFNYTMQAMTSSENNNNIEIRHFTNGFVVKYWRDGRGGAEDMGPMWNVLWLENGPTVKFWVNCIPFWIKGI